MTKHPTIKQITYWLFIRIPFWTVLVSLLLVLPLKWVPVRYTPVMLKRSFQFRKVENYHTEQVWVPLEKIAPDLIQAVIASEDNRFAEHRGFDRDELEIMWTEHKEKGKGIRGCSTISQQVAKNVFTFGNRTWIRKASEAWWTFLIEQIWGKRRIMEVYLNVVETGPGLYGMEAAANHYYGKRAKGIDRKQACIIAASLPAPLERAPDHQTAYLRKRRAQIYALISTLEYPEWAL